MCAKSSFCLRQHGTLSLADSFSPRRRKRICQRSSICLRKSYVRRTATTMIEIAEVLPPSPTRLWTLVQQVGVTHAVGSLPWDERGSEQPWDYMPLLRMKKRFEDAGFTLSVIESRPPLDKAKRGLDGRDEEIATVCTLIENMGRLGIPVWCYEWMAVFNWMRTSMSVPARGGALVTGYDNDLMRDAPLTEAGVVTEEQLWENLEYFLKKVVPVAEKWNVQLAMHPDDPPLSPN